MAAKTKEDNVRQVIYHRQRTKQRLIKAFGNCCGICGYNKASQALEFHHLDPKEKEFSFGSFQSKGWLTVMIEMKKCVMLCSCCHKEVHAGVTQIPNNIQRFDEILCGYTSPMDKRSKLS